MCGVPIMAQWKWIRLVSMRTQVRSLPSFNGLRIWRCHELWCRLVAAAPIQHLAWEPPYALGVALKRQKNFLFIYLFIFCLFRATPAGYGNSQARGQIGAVAPGLYHSYSNTRSGVSWVCHLHHSSQQYQILNPLGKARDWTWILMDTSQVLYLLHHNGNSYFAHF